MLCQYEDLEFGSFNGKPKATAYLTCTRLTLIVTRSISEGRNFCPRLRFGLRWNVSFLTACSIAQGRCGRRRLKNRFV